MKKCVGRLVKTLATTIALVFVACNNDVSVPDPPGAATILPGDMALYLNWAPTANTTAYEVWYSTNHDPFSALQSSGDISTTNHTITNLENGLTYYVWLKAKNGFGSSAWGPDASATLMPRYAVAYHAGTGDTLGTVPVDGNRYLADAPVFVLSNTGQLCGPVIRDGIRQRFVAWNTSADGTGETRRPGESFTITGDVALHAIYTTDDSVLGKIGPAGGWIFHDAGEIRPWGRYLEAAHMDLPDSAWGTYGNTQGPTNAAIGTGRTNTTLIISMDTAVDKAADRCDAYTVAHNGNVFSDWFLPSRDELNAMYLVLKASNIGSFRDDWDSWYWSSTAKNQSSLVYTQTFHDGTQWAFFKQACYMVRPVRAFQ